MNKKQSQHISTLYYRLYVTYFQADQNILKLTNRNAFYRLIIYEGNNKIAQMAEGNNPVILADKIFLNNAVLNFSSTTNKTLLRLKLNSHSASRDVTLGQADLDLFRINDNYLQFTQRFNSLQSILFSGQGGELKLIFNIYVEKNKVDLDLYIKKFKQNEREVMRAKRYAVKVKKIEAQQRIAQRQNRIQQQKNFQSQEGGLQKTLEQRDGRDRSRSRSMKNKKLRDAIQNNSTNYLQINSAARFKDNKIDSKSTYSKKLLSQIEEKQFNTYTTKMQSSSNSKKLSYNNGTNSIISDGSEQSEMINNNLSQSYSQRAVARFRQKTQLCVNIFLTIIVLTLLYFLLSPRAKIQKRTKVKNRIKISQIAEQITEI